MLLRNLTDLAGFAAVTAMWSLAMALVAMIVVACIWAVALMGSQIILITG